MQNNPLQKYFRQPKIYLSLPSKGQFYPAGSINGDPTNLPVYGMSAMDEIMFKTPDALFNGDATVEVIKSCIPGIMHPWVMPQLDVDACLIAIRIATYGQTIETKFKCSKCSEDNKFDLDLSRTLDYFMGLNYQGSIIAGPFLINLRPLTYKELTQYNIKTYELRRKLYQVADLGLSEEEKNKQLNETYKEIGLLSARGFRTCVTSIEVDNEVVTDEAQIDDWIENSDKEFFDKVVEHLKKQSDEWRIQTQNVNCASCDTPNTVALGLDNSNFFASR